MIADDVEISVEFLRLIFTRLLPTLRLSWRITTLHALHGKSALIYNRV
jgi:hypothetical protein